jgi:hypothetical protein
MSDCSKLSLLAKLQNVWQLYECVRITKNKTDALCQGNLIECKPTVSKDTRTVAKQQQDERMVNLAVDFFYSK